MVLVWRKIWHFIVSCIVFSVNKGPRNGFTVTLFKISLLRWKTGFLINRILIRRACQLGELNRKSVFFIQLRHTVKVQLYKATPHMIKCKTFSWHCPFKILPLFLSSTKLLSRMLKKFSFVLLFSNFSTCNNFKSNFGCVLPIVWSLKRGQPEINNSAIVFSYIWSYFLTQPVLM